MEKVSAAAWHRLCGWFPVLHVALSLSVSHSEVKVWCCPIQGRLVLPGELFQVTEFFSVDTVGWMTVRMHIKSLVILKEITQCVFLHKITKSTAICDKQASSLITVFK